MNQHQQLLPLLVSMLLVGGRGPVIGAESAQPGIDTPFAFKILPGTPEWKKASDSTGPHEACQMPQSLAVQMTTRALAETCMSYPMRIDILAFSDSGGPETHIQEMRKWFNGLDELLKRKDAGTEILARFEKLQVEGVAGGDMRPVITVFDLAFITGLILYPPILDGLKKEEQQKLLRSSLVHARKIRTSSKQRSVSENYMAEIAMTLLVDKHVTLVQGKQKIDKTLLPSEELSRWRASRGLSADSLDRVQTIAELVL